MLESNTKGRCKALSRSLYLSHNNKKCEIKYEQNPTGNPHRQQHFASRL